MSTEPKKLSIDPITEKLAQLEKLERAAHLAATTDSPTTQGLQRPQQLQRTQRLQQLRHVMHGQHIAACIIPSSDPHLSEYLPGHWQGRAWLSGFCGSVGTLIVTDTFAGLWVDSRYWVQAENELAGSGVSLMKTSSGASQEYIYWLATTLPAGTTVAIDGAVLGLSIARALQHALQEKGVLLNTTLDLLGEVWQDRPALPNAPIYPHLPPFATITRAEKLSQLRTAMRQHGVQHHFISTLDDIAWLFNLRGSDVSYNPVFVAHALLGMERAILFVKEGKISPDFAAVLMEDGVELAPYEQAACALASLRRPSRILLDPRRITLGLRQALSAEVEVVEAINPSTFSKSRKNDAEAAHVRQTMEQDGAALCEFFAWLEPALQNRAQNASEPLTELSIDVQITAARQRRPHFVCPSFATIAGFNANGALPHYRATEQAHAIIQGDGLLLIDSGGQYLGGTTDITRVVPVGQVNAAQKRDVTLVLKGLIALSSTRFPRGTKSPMLDSIARAPIWAEGIDYGHGTGHGVGYFMNVHEGPQSIAASAMPEAHTAMEPGMISSIEPGIYRLGRWGVRLENLVLNQAAEVSEFGEYLRFETLTLCPIDTRCLDLSVMRPDEITWLNAYHALVRNRLAPHVSGAASQWLELRTQAISSPLT